MKLAARPRKFTHDARQLCLPFGSAYRQAARATRHANGGALSASDFRALQSEWDKRLRATGFVDIEWRHTKGPDYIQRPRGRLDPAIGSYYRLAERFAQELDDEHDRAVWLAHAQGLSRVSTRDRLALQRDREVRTRFESIRQRFRWWMDRCLLRDTEESAQTHETDEEEIAQTFARLSGGL